MITTPTPMTLWHSDWKISLFGFWLIRCLTVVARAWLGSVEVIHDWLFAARVELDIPHVCMTMQSRDIPPMSFNGSLWNLLLRCSTMVAMEGLGSFEMIHDWLFAARSQTRPPSCFYDSSVQRYPFDVFQWKSMELVAKVL